MPGPKTMRLDSGQAIAAPTPHANWGTAPTIAMGAGSDDRGGRVTVTAQATTGANPTLVFVFADGFGAITPRVAVSRGDIVAPTTGFWAVTAKSPTGFTVTFVGTPTATNVYVLDYICLD